jgi:hypothetical protein
LYTGATSVLRSVTLIMTHSVDYCLIAKSKAFYCLYVLKMIAY